jgi:hypothetical protein
MAPRRRSTGGSDGTPCGDTPLGLHRTQGGSQKSALETLDTYGHMWPDADEQARNILNEALVGLRKEDSKFGVLDKT